MANSTRADVEQVFGVENVKKWADLDNDQDPTKISTRIASMITDADAEIESRLRGSVVKLPFATPVDRLVVKLSATLAGVLLYEARGVQDFDEVTGAPQHRLTWHRSQVQRTIRDLRAGRLRITGASYIAVPQVVEDD